MTGFSEKEGTMIGSEAYQPDEVDEDLERAQVALQRLPFDPSGRVQIYCHAGQVESAKWVLHFKAGEGYTARNVRLCDDHLEELGRILKYHSEIKGS
jgi:hypothetical protein